MRTKAIDFQRAANRELRALVYSRDDFTCRACGWRPPAERIPTNYDGRYTVWVLGPLEEPMQILHLDHIKPRCAGGPSIAANMQTLCGSCNSRKAGRL